MAFPSFPPYPWLAPLVDRLEAHLAQEPYPRDAAHDLAHILRVGSLARTIAEAEGADAETCVAAGLLHDLVYLPKNHPDSSKTAAMAAELVPRWCRETPGLESRAEAIAEAVESHSWSGGQEPRTLEARVVQDADRLEALGAIGIARVFATGASFGAHLWHPTDPWARGRELDDKAYSLDHFPRKLLKLADAMKTCTGRAMAEKRQAALLVYLEALKEELG